jgi:bacterioferritin-associated ferredoxin
VIVCSCNVLTDAAIRECIANSPVDLTSADQVYEQLGCAPQCGRCAQTIAAILQETHNGSAQELARVEEDAVA